MSGPEEKRRFQRVAAGVRVHYRGAPLDRRERSYLEGVAADLSLGGMFLATRRPFPPGSVVWLAFELRAPPRSGEEAAEELGIRAKAIVRWRRRWRRPRGMGLEFVEFEGLGQRDLARVMERLLVD